MNSKTIILPAFRSIREKISSKEQNSFLDNYITIGDFFSNATFVENLKFVDDDTKELFLLKASDFKAFDKLQIKRNFLTFTKNSSYIFSFFQELSTEKVSLDEIILSDVYGEFEEHIEILKQLYQRYEELLISNNLIDTIYLPKYYKINQGYSKN